MKDEGRVEMVSFCDTGFQNGCLTHPNPAGGAHGEKQSLFLGRDKMPGNYAVTGRVHS